MASAKPTGTPSFSAKGMRSGMIDRLELLGQVIDLVVGHGDEAPVLLPGAVVERLDQLDLLVEPLHVDRPEGHAHPGLHDLHRPGQPLVHRLVGAHGQVAALVDEQVLGLPEAGVLHQLHVVGRVVRHHDGGRRVEPVHQEPALVVDRERGGAPHGVEAAGAEPGGRGVEERVGDGLVVVRTRRSRRSRPGRRGSRCGGGWRWRRCARRPPRRGGQEVLGLAVLEEGVLGAVEQHRARRDAAAGPSWGPPRGAGRAGR